MSLCSQHSPDKVWQNCSPLGIFESLSEMTNVSMSSPGAEDAWVEDTVTEVTMEASHEEVGEVTTSQVSLLYTEFRKYVSPFTLTVLMSGSFLCILVFFGFCYVVRINQKRIRRRNVTRLDSVRSLDWVSGSRYNTGPGDGHSTLSSRLPPSPASASPLRRISSYSPPHCLHTPGPRVSSVTSYPVVTPSAAATSFAGPRPTPVTLIPHANYSSYCTAGLYQSRLRSPRPLSCIAGIADLNAANSRPVELPKAKLSITSISIPNQAKFERDYMSIAEVSEQRGNAKREDDVEEEDLDKQTQTNGRTASRRRSSVYL